MDSRIIKAVNYYSGLGWKIFPLHEVKDGKCSCGKDDCNRQAKHPRTKNGFKDATSDIIQIEEWWYKWPTANIGLATGEASGVVVLDEDGPDGAASLSQFEIPTTAFVKTGKGRHWYFQHPGIEVANFTAALPGLDFRGDGGYVVAPPSNHISGSTYEWVNNPQKIKPAACPKWLIELCKTKKPDDTGTNMKVPEGGEVIPSGRRNATLTSLAGTMRKRGMSAKEILPALSAINQSRCVPRLSDRELILIVNSVTKYTPAEHIGVPEPQEEKKDVIKLMENRLEAIRVGEYQSLPWPWPMFTRLTQSLIPGKMTMIIGSPGASKSFSLLQACYYWIKNNIPAAIFAYEDDIEFHSQRLLAQISGDSRYTDLEWVKENSKIYGESLKKHAEEIIKFGEHWHMATDEDTQDDLIAWMDRKAKSGCRVLGIDPITMAEQTAEPWVADKVFVKDSLKILKKYGSSLILVTHPQKGQKATMETMAGGASYGNFSPTVISIHRHDEKTSTIRKFTGYNTELPLEEVKHNSTFRLEKTRNGRGNGLAMAFMFDSYSLTFHELGIICKDKKVIKENNEEKRKDLN